jgi:hypothetical protein
MHIEARHFVHALAGAIALGGCHDLDPRIADAATTREDACVASDGGCAQAPPSCGEPDQPLQRMRECDGSELTVCETDVHLDPRHCGECMKPCDGMCWDGECHAIDRLLQSGSNFAELPGSIAVSRDYVYVITTGESMVERIFRPTREVTTFEQGIGTIQAIGVGSNHLYMLSGGTLWSKAVLGAEDPQMMVTGVDTFAAHKPVVAWVDTFGAVRQKNQLVGATVSLGADDSADLVAVSEGRTVAVKRSSTGKPGYTVFVRPTDAHRLDAIGEGDGDPRRVEVVRGKEVFVLSGSGATSEIMRFFIDSERDPVRYTSSHAIADFAADDMHLYVSWSNGAHGGIDAVALENRDEYVVSTGLLAAPIQLVIDGDELFFVEYSPRALSRIDTSVLKRPLPDDAP